MIVRPATDGDDRLAIGQVYVDSWRAAYRGLIPQAYLDGLDARNWLGVLDAPQRTSFLLLDRDIIAGTCSCCPARSPEMAGWGEVVSLYLKPAYWGRGLGVPLLGAALDELAGQGYLSVYLWVLKGNLRAQAFYRRQGFAPSGAHLEGEVGGQPVEEIQYTRLLA